MKTDCKHTLTIIKGFLKNSSRVLLKYVRHVKFAGEIVSRSPKLPSPPISRCESSLNVQLPLDRPQANFLTQFNGHNSWSESSKGIHQRPSFSPGHGFAKATPPLPSSVSVLDSLHGDLPDPSSQVNYNSGFTSPLGPSSHRDY
ncbi:hypothetical protein AFCA_013330 [Aspergillus flavus]|nr:hypothetical protein AFCA_013330 [Aspergillus flavus]